MRILKKVKSHDDLKKLRTVKFENLEKNLELLTNYEWWKDVEWETDRKARAVSRRKKSFQYGSYWAV